MQYNTVSETYKEEFDKQCTLLSSQGYIASSRLCVTAVPEYELGESNGKPKTVILYVRQFVKLDSSPCG